MCNATVINEASGLRKLLDAGTPKLLNPTDTLSIEREEELDGPG